MHGALRTAVLAQWATCLRAAVSVSDLGHMQAMGASAAASGHAKRGREEEQTAGRIQPERSKRARRGQDKEPPPPQVRPCMRMAASSKGKQLLLPALAMQSRTEISRAQHKHRLAARACSPNIIIDTCHALCAALST